MKREIVHSQERGAAMTKLYYTDSARGVCLVAACTLEQARREARSRVGEGSIGVVRLATEDDVSWVEGMGGNVPVIGESNAR